MSAGWSEDVWARKCIRLPKSRNVLTKVGFAPSRDFVSNRKRVVRNTIVGSELLDETFVAKFTEQPLDIHMTKVPIASPDHVPDLQGLFGIREEREDKKTLIA